MASQDIQLYVESPLLTFDASQRDSFLDILDLQDRHTLAFPLDVAEQILLTPACVTQRGGYRLSVMAFRQLCRAACPGLSNVVADVAGLRRHLHDADRDRFSVSDAIQLLNTVVQRRFLTELNGLQAIRDTRTGVIEGLVGRSYRRLSNLEVAKQSDEVLRLYRHPVDFYQGRLCGRYMVLCYRDRDPMFTVDLGRRKTDVFYGGFYFSNSETGDGSVRATTALIRDRSDNKALGFFGRKGRLIHAGKDFARRFQLLLNAVADCQPDRSRLQDGVVRLAETPLGFGDTEDDCERRFIELVHFLRAKQLTHSLAKRIVRGILVQDSFDEQPISDIRYVRREVWPTRTAYDLFNSMTRVAKELPITVQERVEQLAYALLTGRITASN